MSVTFSLDPHAIGWIVFDAPGARANVFNAPTQDALSNVIDGAAASGARALVIAGTKERIFIAGADLRWLQELPDPAAAEAFSRRGQLLFERIADMRVPVVCAIHGACAGGGYELALACHWRIATDASVTQLGLPETSVGTIPGWGGCVRLPRLVGAECAIDHILRGQLVDAQEALRLGLVDELVPPGDLKARAAEAALRLADEGHPVRKTPPGAGGEFFSAARQTAFARTGGHQPAPLAAIDAVAESISKPTGEALEIEARWFGEVTAGEVCKNLIHAFFLRDSAKKAGLERWREGRYAGAGGPPVRRVGIVGAGVMGSGIAHWLATRGYDVVLRDVQLEFLERALGVIRGLLDEGVKRGKFSAEDAGLVLGRIRTTTSWDGFSGCDLVIDAIAEDVGAKRSLFSRVAQIARPDALLASNTSALPIEDIAGHVQGRDRVLGCHFFNPVSRMSLVELVLGRETSVASAERALDLVRALGKTPLVCRSSPGFLVTRVLFFYLNAAVALWERGVDALAMDKALREFGWPMGPLRLIDEVGLDVTDRIFTEMEHYFPGRFVRSATCGTLLGAGLKGRKNGTSRGFYRHVGSQEALNREEVDTIVGARPHPPADLRTGEEIVAALMCVMVDEAQRCLAEGVVPSRDEVDFGLLAGAGFPAFRGGLLHWAEQHGVTPGMPDAAQTRRH